MGEEYRRSYVVFYLVYILELYLKDLEIKKKETHQVMFLYLSFLMEIHKVSTKSFIELSAFEEKQQNVDRNNLNIIIYYSKILAIRNNKTFKHFFFKPKI